MTNNVERHIPNDIANVFISAASLLQMKHKGVRVFASGIFPRIKETLEDVNHWRPTAY